MPLIEETQSGSTTSILNAYALGADGVRERYSAPLGSYYSYTFDPMGNPVRRETQSAAEGNEDDVSGYYAVSTSEFDGYGDETADLFDNSGGAVSSSQHVGVGYAGEWGSYTDPETGLLSLGHRYYDPGTGRFVSRDPIGYAGGDNLYTYAGNNPVNNFDPDGLDWADNGANASAGVGDSLTFGFTALIRHWLGVNNVDENSGYYIGGEVAETTAEIALTGGGKVLVGKAAKAIAEKALADGISQVAAKKALQAGLRSQARSILKNQGVNIAGQEVHHVIPLLGHSGVAVAQVMRRGGAVAAIARKLDAAHTIFPSLGIPAVANSRLFIRALSPGIHTATHVRDIYTELGAKALFNPYATGLRAGADAYRSR